MPRQETRARRHSPEQDEEEYILFLHEELKDLAKEYGLVHYRSADTIKPHHETGYIFIAGRQNAEQAFNQFRQRGWRGQSIVVTLNGPVDRARMQSGCSDRLKIVVGPVRSPGFDGRASQRRQLPDWNVLHAAAMANYMQQRTPLMTLVSTAPQRSPTTSVHVVAPITVPPAYRTQTTYVRSTVNPPTVNARHAPPALHMPVTMHHADTQVHGNHNNTRHAAPIPTLQMSHVATHHAIPVTQPIVARNPAAPEPAWRSVRVQNLDSEFRKINVQKFLERFGTLEACRIQQERDSRGRVKSLTAFASYSEAVYAAKALVALNGKQVNGRRLSVTFDTRTDRNRDPQSSGRLTVATTNGRNVSRHRSGRHGEEDDERHPGQSTKGPLVVDGAPGSGRRRRDADSRERGSSSNDQSDSDASDEERESRRGDSGGRCSAEHRMDDMTRMTRGVRV